ncbi:SAM-dependent methyltransferase [Streptomyces sp. NPDC020607]|uniref:SAM-dependent methyltransferase n=1 Tax=Streptomyces sp. NPDC020607 TaxID=3365082 RepID=UPI00378E712D
MTTTEPPSVTQFQELVVDPRRRHAEYATMVPRYYQLVGDIYQQAWGASQHFAPYRSGQSRAEAITAVEHDLADRAGIAARDRVLEVGSGVGGPACTVAARTGARVTGVDLVPGRVRAARRAARERGLDDRVSFHVADATRLPFTRAAFTAAYSFEALCHVPDKARAHAEVARVLHPGGVWSGYDWVRADSAGTSRVVETICRAHGVAALSTLDELHRDLMAAGFTDIHVSDARTLGDWEANWVLLEELLGLLPPPEQRQPVLGMMADGGRALCDGARSGEFLIGHWYARRPGRTA